ncbi:hypothetical protein C8F04DRAFT_966399 [Mycena alexandri]|uniref:Uncharacterized protein n=1 Tax=Mycena alexandri TaxID=1745969 RepID=A0AAD6WWW5_9AGAR|nr:hypothetical protein C8F04DRAFT_966399 [Mycena alexandri]
MAVGDGVVVWRTWAVYQHRAQRRILVILLPGTLLLLTFIFSIIDTWCNNYASVAPTAAICNQAGLIGWGLSAATNIACTIFIGLKARQHRKITRPLGKPSRMSGEKALSILFDSGFIYSLLWFSQIISVFGAAQVITLTSPAVYLWGIISAMGNQMAGLYPTLVICVVNLRRTIWEAEEASLPTSLRWTPNSKGSAWTGTFGTQGGDDAVRAQSVLHITSDKVFVDANMYPRVQSLQ